MTPSSGATLLRGPGTGQRTVAARRRKRSSALAFGLGVALVALLTVTTLIAVILGGAQPTGTGCAATAPADTPAGGAIAAGLFAAALVLEPGASYQVGATRYGGPSDPTSGDYGSIGDPGESYLPAHPDTFAELSTQDTNAANTTPGAFTFADANALNNLPYMTALHVEHDGREEILYKRDIGYGQGPGQTIPNGQPYRLDLWWQAANTLDVSKSPVTISLAPATGAANTLGQTPTATLAATASTPAALAAACAPAGAASSLPLALVPGTQTQILPSGLAAAGQNAPAAVAAMVAAGNRLFGLPYLYGGGHGTSLDTLASAYDCSSSVSYVLHAGGTLGPNALDSGELETWGLPGPGRYVSVYATAGHAFMYVAGLRLDTVYDPAFDTGPNSGQSGPRWRVYPGVPDWSTWIVRHPPGL